MKTEYVVQWSPHHANHFIIGSNESSDLSVCRMIDKQELVAEHGNDSNELAKCRTVGQLALPQHNKLKCLDWNPSLDRSRDVCFGTSRGLALATLNQGIFGSSSLFSTKSESPEVVKLDPFKGSSRICNSVAWCPHASGRIAAGYQYIRKNNSVVVCDVSAGVKEGAAQHLVIGGYETGVEALAWDPSHSSIIVVGTSNKYLYVYDERASNHQAQSYVQDTMRGPVHAVKFDPHNPTMLATYDDHGVARVWDTRRLRSPAAKIVHGDRLISQIGWSPIRMGVLAVAEERWIYLYDTKLASNLMAFENLERPNAGTEPGPMLSSEDHRKSRFKSARRRNRSDSDLATQGNSPTKGRTEGKTSHSRPTTPKGDKEHLDPVTIAKPIRSKRFTKHISNFVWRPAFTTFDEKGLTQTREGGTGQLGLQNRMLVVSEKGTEVISMQDPMPIAWSCRGSMAMGVNQSAFETKTHQFDPMKDLRELAESNYSIDATNNCAVLSEVISTKEKLLATLKRERGTDWTRKHNGEIVAKHSSRDDFVSSMDAKNNTIRPEVSEKGLKAKNGSSSKHANETHRHHHHSSKSHQSSHDSEVAHRHHHHQKNISPKHATQAAESQKQMKFISAAQEKTNVIKSTQERISSLRDVLGFWEWVKQAEALGIGHLHNIGLCHLFRAVSDSDMRSHSVNSGLRGSLHLRRSDLRKAALALCGWAETSFGSSEPDAEVFRGISQCDRAAARSILQCNLARAVHQLRQGVAALTNQAEGGSRRSVEVLNMVSVTVAGFPLSGNAVLWPRACLDLLRELPEFPCLAAAVKFLLQVYLQDTDVEDMDDQMIKLRADPLDTIFEEKAFTLVEKAAFACLYLPDEELRRYLLALLKQAVERGQLSGIVLSGLGVNGARLMQQYVEKSGDVQTVALARLHMSGRHKPAQVRQIHGWVESYRELLDRWQLWEERARLDVHLGALSRGTVSHESSDSPPPISSALSAVAGQGAALALVKAAFGERPTHPGEEAGQPLSPDSKVADGPEAGGPGSQKTESFVRSEDGEQGASWETESHANSISMEHSEDDEDTVRLLGPTVIESHITVKCGACLADIAAESLMKPKKSIRGSSSGTNKRIVPYCPRCKVPLPSCAVCLLSMTSHNFASRDGRAKKAKNKSVPPVEFSQWFSWCLQCGHGGHASCLVDWFEEHPQCPVSNCPCTCSGECS